MANPVPVTYNAAASPVAGGRFIVSEFWRNLAPGWTKVPTTAPNGAPPGGIAAYSGMAVNGRGHRLFLFGGGHNDYYGNEVWRLDLNSLEWSRDYAPDIGANPPIEDIWPRVNASTLPGGYTDTMRPYSRHTYDSVHWLPDQQRLIVGGGSSYSGTGEYLWDHLGGPHLNAPKDTWFYDPAGMQWEFKGSTLLNAAYLAASRSAYDSVTQRLYALGRNVGGNWVVYEYNPATNTWTNHNVAAVESSGDNSVGFDTARGRLLVMGGLFPTSYKIMSYDVIAKTWAELGAASALQPPAGAGYGVTFDAIADRYIATNNGTAWVFNPATGQWAQGAGGPPSVAQVVGRLEYDPIRKCTLLVYRNGASGPIDTWAYKTEQL